MSKNHCELCTDFPRLGSDEHVAFWDAINAYVVSCGGDPSKHVYGNTTRMTAVAKIEEAARHWPGQRSDPPTAQASIDVNVAAWDLVKRMLYLNTTHGPDDVLEEIVDLIKANESLRVQLYKIQTEAEQYRESALRKQTEASTLWSTDTERQQLLSRLRTELDNLRDAMRDGDWMSKMLAESSTKLTEQYRLNGRMARKLEAFKSGNAEKAFNAGYDEAIANVYRVIDSAKRRKATP